MLRPEPLHPLPLGTQGKKANGQISVELILLMMVIVVAVMLMMPYLKRSSAGRVYSLISSLGQKPFEEGQVVQYSRVVSRNITTYHNFVPADNEADGSSNQLTERVVSNESVEETVTEKYEVPI